MANFKRKRPKTHVVIDCCYNERTREIGNNPRRVPRKDRRKPQHFDENGKPLCI